MDDIPEPCTKQSVMLDQGDGQSQGNVNVSKSSAKREREIVFRKWIPCGKCRACNTTVNCGTCASCRNAQQTPGKPVRCRKRKCLCPIRKAPFRHEVALASLAFTGGMFIEEWQNPGASRRWKRVSQDSDSDDYEPIDDDDEDEEEEDEDGEQIKRKRRTCGRCEGCVVMRDCGVCDFCVDKPKFGGSNKKRQKCRRRQCTRQAMRHLLPLQLGGSLGKKRRGLGSRESWEFEFSDNENEDQASRAAREAMAYKTYSRQNPGRGTEESRNPPVSQTHTQQKTHTPVVSGRPTSSASQLPQSASAPRAEAAGVPWPAAAEVRKGAVPTAAIREGRGRSDTALPNQGGVGRVQETPLTSRDGERRAQETAVANQHRVGRVQETALANEDVWGRVEAASLSNRDGERPVEEAWDGLGGMDNEDEVDGIPMITQIFSLADSGISLDGDLLSLLEGLRAASLPQLWLPILGSGPTLQLLQCSKASAMSDTAVHIGPGLGFSVTVQDQPLVPTHPLYAQHPARMTTPDQVVALLRDLERHAVCQGVRSHAPAPPNEPLVNVRLATCHFLVPRSRIRCSKCRYPTDKN